MNQIQSASPPLDRIHRRFVAVLPRIADPHAIISAISLQINRKTR